MVMAPMTRSFSDGDRCESLLFVLFLLAAWEAVGSVQEIRKFDSFRPLAQGVHPLVGLASQQEISEPQPLKAAA